MSSDWYITDSQTKKLLYSQFSFWFILIHWNFWDESGSDSVEFHFIIQDCECSSDIYGEVNDVCNNTTMKERKWKYLIEKV